MTRLYDSAIWRLLLLLICLLLLNGTRASPSSSATRTTATKTSKTSHTPTTTKSKTTKTKTTSSSSSGALPVFTWRSAPTVQGCPPSLTTASFNSFTVTDSTGVPQFTAFTNPTGAVVPQVIVPDASNASQQYIFNFRNTSKFEMFYVNGGQQRVVIDQHEVSIYTANCSDQFNLPIANLTSVLNKYGSQNSTSSKPRRRYVGESYPTAISLQRRTNYTYVVWKVSYKDQCSDPVTSDHNASAYCQLTNPYAHSDSGLKSVALTNLGDGSFRGVCSYPEPNSAEQECENTIKGILDWPSEGLFGQLTNLGTDLGILAKLVQSSSLARLVAGAAGILDAPAFVAAIGALALYQGFTALGGDDLIASHLCPYLLDIELTVTDKLDVEQAYNVANHQTTAPFTSFAATSTVKIPSITSCTTTTPAPSCTGKPSLTHPPCANPVSGCQNAYYNCGPSTQDCLCGFNVDGSSMCFPYGFCIASDCKTDADCTCGGACLTADTCCGRSICVDTASCANGAQKVREYFLSKDPRARPIVKNIRWTHRGA